LPETLHWPPPNTESLVEKLFLLHWHLSKRGTKPKTSSDSTCNPHPIQDGFEQVSHVIRRHIFILCCLLRCVGDFDIFLRITTTFLIWSIDGSSLFSCDYKEIEQEKEEKEGHVLSSFTVLLYIYSLFCLKVVFKLSVPEYILTLKIWEYCLSTALVLP